MSAHSNDRTGNADIATAFLKLGCTAFGGPVAHIGYLRAEFVERRRWLDDAEFADLVALCQFLPGPASSQLVFALGMRRGGLAGAMLASLAFTLPSAILMVAFGYMMMSLGDISTAGWLHGLKLAAVAVVAHAVWGMAKNLCPDTARRALAAGAAAFVLLAPGAFAQVSAIAAGAIAGALIYGRARDEPNGSDTGLGRRHLVAAGCLALFAALLLALPALAAATGIREAGMASSFYRAGSLVFGGGHVILPLLRAEVVPNGWMSDDAFLAGYGAAQAVPGPLFTLAGYLGTVIRGGAHAWTGGALALFAIFLPAWLLIGGALPFWHSLKHNSRVRSGLLGANAAVVGVLFAALCTPVASEAIFGFGDALAAAALFATLMYGRIPSWTIVAVAALAGHLFA